jgi:hypothetical protein
VAAYTAHENGGGESGAHENSGGESGAHENSGGESGESCFQSLAVWHRVMEMALSASCLLLLQSSSLL